jgi:hypothetical protein
MMAAEGSKSAPDAGAPEVVAWLRGCLIGGETASDLGAVLHKAMERFDPTQDDKWSELPESRKAFFRLCAREVLVALYEMSRGIDGACYDAVDGGRETSGD